MRLRLTTQVSHSDDDEVQPAAITASFHPKWFVIATAHQSPKD